MPVQADDITLYPMTMDVRGLRTHEEYVDAMAKMIVDMVIDYRIDYPQLQLLVHYAEDNHYRLNK